MISPNTILQNRYCINRMLRGGSWFFSATRLRSAIRDRVSLDSRDYDGGYRAVAVR